MKRYLIDTSPLVAYLLGRSWAVRTVEPMIEGHEAVTSIAVYGEAVEYLKSRSDFAARHIQLQRQLEEITPYLPTFPIMERYADLRRALRPPHGAGLIGDIDTLIAATALENGLSIVTMDSDFDRIPNGVPDQISARCPGTEAIIYLTNRGRADTMTCRALARTVPEDASRTA